jgi:hypothetical protein
VIALGKAETQETNMNWLDNDLFNYVAQDPTDWSFLFDSMVDGPPSMLR